MWISKKDLEEKLQKEYDRGYHICDQENLFSMERVDTETRIQESWLRGFDNGYRKAVIEHLEKFGEPTKIIGSSKQGKTSRIPKPGEPIEFKPQSSFTDKVMALLKIMENPPTSPLLIKARDVLESVIKDIGRVSLGKGLK